MGWESYGVVRFDLKPLLQGQTRVTKLKSVYNSLIIAPIEVWNVRLINWKSLAGNLLMFSYLTLGHFIKIKHG